MGLNVFGGVNQIPPRKHKTFTKKDNFLVQGVNSMLFDNNGWLWIAGLKPADNTFTLKSSRPIIQRFNGSSFHTIPLPDDDLRSFNAVFIKKRTDGQLYVHYSTENQMKLYVLNPVTLEFTEVKFADFDSITELTFFPYKDAYIAFVNVNGKSYIYLLENDLSLTLLNEVPDLPDIYVTHFMEFEDHFVIGSGRIGILTFDHEGNLLDGLSAKSIGLDVNRIDYKLTFNTVFNFKGEFYADFFAGSDEYYRYDSKSKKWNYVSFFKDSLSNERNHKIVSSLVHQDENGNLLKIQKNEGQEGIRIKRYINDLKNYSEFQLFNVDKESKLISNNFEKELYITSEGELHHLVFESEYISIFLKDYSIRGILPLSNHEFIVATERNGWYLIDVITKEVELYELNLHGQAYLIDENRGFFKTDSGFWSTYNKGIVHVDQESRELETYPHFPVSAMVEDGDNIYYGTIYYKLVRFDKNSKTHQILADTDTLLVQDIYKRGDNIYLATESGFFEYKNGKSSLMRFDDPKDNFLMSLNYSNRYGLLVGSRSGKLFQYDTLANTFNILYEDSVEASIATIMFDHNARIWLNTFAGMVAFDPENRTVTRFGEGEGMSHYESNRYSAATTGDGHFLVGTLKGLNYFHPDSLDKVRFSANLTLSALSYYDQATGKRVEELRPNHLNTIERIQLPAEHRSVDIEFGLLGNFINETVSYRYSLDDQNWVDLNANNKLSLINIAPGNYTLKVEALTGSQERIGELLTLDIHASDFFYRSVWFYLIIIVVVALLALWYIYQLKKQHEIKEQFTKKLINTQENERSRIAGELHDSIGQKLLILKNTILLQSKDQSTDLQLVEDTINEVRDMSHKMHPFQFKQLGFSNSLRNLMDEFQRTSNIFFSYDIEDIDPYIAENNSIFLFRMLQEAITNVEKHAGATACNLIATVQGKSVLFIIKDNGKGFKVKELDEYNSLGLKTMEEKAQYINATVRIDSEEGRGTMIKITIPRI